MIVIVARPETLAALEAMNQVGRYLFYPVKAIAPDEIVNEIQRLAECSHIVVELAMFETEDSTILLEPLAGEYEVVVLAGELNPYDVVIRDYYSMGITHVITATGADMQKQLNELLYASGQAIQVSPAEPIGPVPAADTGDSPSQAAGQHVASSSEKAHTIAFAGGGPRIGTTTQVFQTAWFLKSMYHTVAIVDFTPHAWMQLDNINCRQLAEGQYLVHGLHWYTDIRRIARLRNEYKYLLFDYGEFASIADTVSFAEKDVQVIVAGTKPQEEQHLRAAFESDAGNYWYLFSFVGDNVKQVVRKQMADSAGKTVFARYSPDYYHYCGDDPLYSALVGHCDSVQRPDKQKQPFWKRLALGGKAQ